MKTVIRKFEEKMIHTTDTTIGTESDYGKELVISIPFKGEMRIKAICIIGGDEGTCPSKVNLYRNEVNPDLSLLDDKKPV